MPSLQQTAASHVPTYPFQARTTSYIHLRDHCHGCPQRSPVLPTIIREYEECYLAGFFFLMIAAWRGAELKQGLLQSGKGKEAMMIWILVF